MVPIIMWLFKTRICILVLIVSFKFSAIERGPPSYLWILVGCFSFPFAVLFLAVFLLIVLRSRKGFRTDVWEYSKQQKEKEQRQKLESDKSIKSPRTIDENNDDIEGTMMNNGVSNNGFEGSP